MHKNIRGIRKPPVSRDLTDFGIWVKKRLLDKNMTVAELSRLIGAKDVYVSRILHGNVSGAKYIDKIVDQLQQ